MALLETGTNSDLVLGDFNKASWTTHQCKTELKCMAQSTARTHLCQALPTEIQRSNINPTLVANNDTTIPQNVDHVMDRKVEKEAKRGDQILEDFMTQPRARDSSVERQQKETALDRISQCIYKNRCRFDFVYHPSTQAKGLVIIKATYKMILTKRRGVVLSKDQVFLTCSIEAIFAADHFFL